MAHHKSAPCLNKTEPLESDIVLLKEKKELEAEYQAAAGKKEKIKGLGHKNNFTCLVLDYSSRIQQSTLQQLRYSENLGISSTFS